MTMQASRSQSRDAGTNAKSSDFDVRSGEKGRVRAVRMRSSGASMERLAGGVIRVWSDEVLGAYPRVLTDRLVQWAAAAPDRVCIAKRGVGGVWNCLTYIQVLAAVGSIGQSLLERELSAERPIMILSENDLEHYC